MPTDGSAVETRVSRHLESAFRDRTRGVKRAGLWAAARLGKSGVDAEVYARTIVAADFDEAGDEDVIAKLRKDLSDLGISDSEIRSRLAHCLAETASGHAP